MLCIFCGGGGEDVLKKKSQAKFWVPYLGRSKDFASCLLLFCIYFIFFCLFKKRLHLPADISWASLWHVQVGLSEYVLLNILWQPNRAKVVWLTDLRLIHHCPVPHSLTYVSEFSLHPKVYLLKYTSRANAVKNPDCGRKHNVMKMHYYTNKSISVEGI